VDLHTSIAPVVIALPADVDITNADSMRERLRSAFGPGVTVVIADMTATAFCDMSGFRILLNAHDEARACDAQLRLVIHRGAVQRVLNLIGFDRLLRVYSNLESARTGGFAR
jgi:anti-sigma B factor antagonist